MEQNTPIQKTEDLSKAHVFAVLLEGGGNTLLHIGIHNSLTEAVSSASPQLRDMSEIKNANFEISPTLWTSFPVVEIMEIINRKEERTPKARHELKTPAQKKMEDRAEKTQLMKYLISKGNQSEVKRANDFLSKVRSYRGYGVYRIRIFKEDYS